jgi:hypothetical protein
VTLESMTTRSCECILIVESERFVDCCRSEAGVVIGCSYLIVGSCDDCPFFICFMNFEIGDLLGQSS